MPRTVLGDVTSWHRLYLAAKPSNMGVDVDGLACTPHRPTACNCQMRGQIFLSGAALSHHATMGSGAFPGGARPPGLDIRWSGNYLGTCQSYHGFYGCILG
jgi:hypothetical protein